MYFNFYNITEIPSGLSPNKGSAVLKAIRPRGISNHPLSPGFRFIIISRYSFSAVFYAAFLTRRIPTFNHRVPQQTRVFASSHIVLCPQQLVIPFRSAVRTFSTDVYTSTMPRLWSATVQPSKIAHIHKRQKMIPKRQPPTERLHFT